MMLPGDFNAAIRALTNAVQEAVRDALELYGLGCHADEYEPMLGNVSYELASRYYRRDAETEEVPR